MAYEAWHYGAAAGRLMALPIKDPKVVVAMVKRAKRPIIVAGSEVDEIELEEGKKVIDYLIKIARNGNIPVVATADMRLAFIERDLEPETMPLMEIVQRLQDPDWKGFDDEGRYDLILFIGIFYDLASQALSSLTNFAPELTTMSIDRHFHPNAKWSFPNASLSEWCKGLKSIASGLSKT